ncbi:hypothetical protein HYH03_014768 [Edaphochlamys debaryana]|uniref:Uncharacterized protein n=1 Tax=Edaphochlamys debaryana TaxID=47281 RepID=A0A835XNA4_9CHLO|nr:hypothetical protein HYH03_014768 [Edaphochlamys debaryana]|eukprot:KAG2486600.1 hypothetical protein HYH03_014768 [Edaphochlamys debaryana]
MKTKGSKQCRRRWKNYLNADLKSGGWTAEEDRILMEGHRLYGNKWTEIAKMVGGRTDNAVKNRYAALCKRDSRGGGGGRRGATGGGGARGRNKARGNSDSDAASDVELDDDSDADEDVKRSSSSFSTDKDSREVSPPPKHVRGPSRMAGDATANGHGPSLRSHTNGATSPRTAANAAAHAAAAAVAVAAPVVAAPGPSQLHPGSGGVGRPSILGRRRTPGSGGNDAQPEYDPEAEAMVAKRRALLPSGAGPGSTSANGRLAAGTPRTPRTPRLLAQLQEATIAAHRQQVQLAAVGTGSGSSGGRTGLRSSGAAAAAGASAPLPAAPAAPLVGNGGKEHPFKKPPLTISIPNDAASEPAPHAAPPSTAYGGIEIRVLKDLLTPCEIQYARELNDMQLPLHMNLVEDPAALLVPIGPPSGGRTSTAAGGGGAAAADPYHDPPLSTSRQGTRDAMAALISPGSALGSAGMGDFCDVLSWFQTVLTPRSTRGNGGPGSGTTPRGAMLGRTGLTPRGLHDGKGLALGTGLTPRGLNGASPTPNGSGAGSPSTRTRRQTAIAAALAAASGAGPGPSSLAAAGHGAQGGQQGGQGQGQFGLGSAMGGGPFSGAELHAGHRQLLARLIQGAAAADTPRTAAEGAAGGPGPAQAPAEEEHGPQTRTRGGKLRPIMPPSPGALFSPGSFLATSRGGPGGPPTSTANANANATAAGSNPGASAPAAATGTGAGAGQKRTSGGTSAQSCTGAGAEGAGGGGIVMMPQFSQQELMWLLDALNSDDMQGLPPPPQ